MPSAANRSEELVFCVVNLGHPIDIGFFAYCAALRRESLRSILGFLRFDIPRVSVWGRISRRAFAGFNGYFRVCARPGGRVRSDPMVYAPF